MEPVRVRYPPSPTGLPHVGNIRTALFNWLLARHTGGQFILRIEDTDRERLVEGAYEAILESLRWLGLDWDEGPEAGGPHAPYIQSERQKLGLYAEAARELVEKGDAYRCYCSTERLEKLRERQAINSLPTGYDRRCRNLSREEQARYQEEGIPPVVRFKMPLTGRTTFHDLLRGDVTWDNARMDDYVLLKADGFPTYHLANVVDDHAMRITHVLRGDEWLASTPRHVLLYQAFGWEPPQFAHLALVLGEDRAKLSKRHGAVALLDFRDDGYLPEAMVNFLALMGWSLDDKTTLISRADLVKHFSLDRVSASPAAFDLDKLKWMNGSYIRQLPLEEFTGRALSFLEDPDHGLPPRIPRPLDRNYVQRVCALLQERVRTLAEMSEQAELFFTDEVIYPPLLIWAGMGDKELRRRAEAGEDLSNVPLPENAPAVRTWLDAALAILKETYSLPADKSADPTIHHVLDIIAGKTPWLHKDLENACRALAGELQVKTGELFGALRVAITGRITAPPLFQSMEVLGRDRTLKRLQAAAARLPQQGTG
ncbi:MAG: glutamate--tRNA ligase [Chloroflexi bacterium]|nr:glutamate--tRNA ligase [Chloroflexota bacterium]